MQGEFTSGIDLLSKIMIMYGKVRSQIQDTDCINPQSV